MAKTNFVNGDATQNIHGTRVAAEFLNAVNNHYHTGLDQDGHGSLAYAEDSGTANVYVINLNPALNQYITGMPIYFKATNANTGASSININGLGAKAIKKFYNQDLINGDIQAGQIVVLTYDGDNFQFWSLSSKLAMLDTSSLVVQDPASKGQANGVASLDANGRLAQNATTIWDGVAGRSVSAASAAYSVPVSGSDSKLARGFIPDNVPGIMTGELSGSNGGVGQSVNTTSFMVSAGDRLLIFVDMNGAGAATGIRDLRVTKAGGAATIQFFGGAASAIQQVYFSDTSSREIFSSVICEATSSGNLQLQFGGSGWATNITVRYYLVFLKKS